MAWGKLSSNDWSSGTDIDSDTFVPKKFIQMMFNTFSAGTNRQSLRFGDPTVDSGNNYSERGSDNGAADGTDTSKNHIIAHTGGKSEFAICYMINIETEEKLIIGLVVNGSENGAGNAPNRREFTSKYAETTNQQTVIRVFDTTADFTGGNHSDLGSDVTPAAAIPFAENAQVGSRAEITDTRKIYHYEDPLTFEDDYASSSAWTTDAGTGVAVSGGEVTWNVAGNQSNQISKAIGSTLSDTTWLAQFEVELSAYSSGEANILALSSGTAVTAQNSTDDTILVRFADTGKYNVSFRTGNGTDYSYVSTIDKPANGTRHYITLVRNSSTEAILYVRTGSHSGTQVTNSPHTVTQSTMSGATGLDTVTQGGWNTGNSGRTLTMVGDNLKIYNGVTSTDTVWSEEGT